MIAPIDWQRRGVVLYSDSNLSIEESFPELLNRLGQTFVDVLCHQVPSPDVDPFEQLLLVAPFLKHQGFSEEREVRVVSSPASNETLEVVRSQIKDFTAPPLKVIHHRHRAEAATPYVVLFDNTVHELPIKRVIVGPSRRQRENHQQAAELLGGAIKLVNSETSFIG
jgi:hypothetical protein